MSDVAALEVLAAGFGKAVPHAACSIAANAVAANPEVAANPLAGSDITFKVPWQHLIAESHNTPCASWSVYWGICVMFKVIWWKVFGQRLSGLAWYEYGATKLVPRHFRKLAMQPDWCNWNAPLTMLYLCTLHCDSRCHSWVRCLPLRITLSDTDVQGWAICVTISKSNKHWIVVNPCAD